MSDGSEFQISGTGVRIVLDNGFTISIQCGGFNYGDHYGSWNGEDIDQRYGLRSSTAEVAVRDKDGKLLAISGPETIRAYQSVSQGLDLIEEFRMKGGDNSAGS